MCRDRRPSGCGKSTLSKLLCELDSKVIVVQMDDFYRPMTDAEGLSLSAEQGCKKFFDWERLREQVLIPISKSQSQISYQTYDWSTKSLGRWETFKSKGIVIVEGVYSMRQELRDYYDSTIFVDTPETVRLARMEARNQNPSQWRERWLAAEKYYNETESPINFAKLVVCGQ